MDATLQAIQVAATLPWIDIAFVSGLILLYSRILYWMERDDDFVYIEEILAHFYLAFLVLFCGHSWLWRHTLRDMQLELAPWIKYGSLMIPAMAHQIVMNWALFDRAVPDEQMIDPIKVQYAVSIIFVTFCWTYLSNME